MAMIRQPVPGVHDLIPPQGRVCVELLDDRGRVRQQVKAENAITDSHVNMVKRMIRGVETLYTSDTAYTPVGYHFHGGQVISNTDRGPSANDWWKYGLALGSYDVPWAGPAEWNDRMRCILLSDSTLTMDTSENHFPGDLTALAYLREPIAPTTNLKLTQLVVASSYRTPTALRYVAEWGTAYGNGTHNSVGIGCAAWDPASQYAWAAYSPLASSIVSARVNADAAITTSWNGTTGGWNYPVASTLYTPYVFGTNNTTSSTTTLSRYQSGHFVSNSEVWLLMSGTTNNTLCKFDFSGLTEIPLRSSTVSAGSGLAVSGPTMTTIGAGTARCGVAVIGSDLWLAYSGTLKRCVKPTGTSLSVTNTYTPGGIETLIDLTADGTWLYWLGATTVYKINATTGAIDSSWAHGLTGTPSNIAYDGGYNAGLLISEVAAGAAAQWHTANGSTGSSIINVSKFSLAGVFQGKVAMNMIRGTSTAYINQGIITTLDAGYKHWLSGLAGSNTSSYTTATAGIFGPSHISRTVLGSPVVKTSSNSMRVTYEFAF